MVDPGLAAIVAAVAAALIGVGGGLLGRVTAPTPSNEPQGTARVTITPPANGDIRHKESYSGRAVNLRPGQLVWTFNQSVGTNGPSDRVYPNSGPCTVDYKNHVWSCRDIYVGELKDTRPFMVCAAIISDSQALQIVNKLRTHDIWFSLSDLPYITDRTPECMPVHRI
jgi:hypothetical protein